MLFTFAACFSLFDRNCIGVYDINTGEELNQLEGHLLSINSLVFHRKEQELYSTGADRQILIWTPKLYNEQWKENLLQSSNKGLQASNKNLDDWSSSEEEVENIGF